MLTIKQRVEKYSVITENGCLRWYKSEDKRGRPYMKVGGRNGKHKSSYRALWEEVKGPIPEGMTIDHTCFVKGCLNLEHMEVVSHKENISRYQKIYDEENTTFKCGHPRWGENRKQTGTIKKGKINPRIVRKYGCRQCHDAYMKRYLKEYMPGYLERKKNAATNDIH